MRFSVRTTLFFLFSTFLMSIVIIPLLYLGTIALSSPLDLSMYPKKLLPRLGYDLKIEWMDEPDELYYSIAYKNNDGEYEDLNYLSSFSRINSYFDQQLNITKSEEQLQIDFEVARMTGEPIYLRYNKAIFQNYIKFFSVVDGAKEGVVNSIQAALWTIGISLSFGGVVGYSLARHKMKGKEAIGVGMLVVRMFPMVAISIPIMVVLIKIGLNDSMLGLAIVYSIPNIALTAWVTRSVFVGINRELEEASLIFGATKFQTFYKITLPLVLPAFAAASMYAFLGAWNDTVVALILSNNRPTLALAIYKSVGASASIHYSAAGAIILIIPALVFTFIIKNYINQLWGES